MNWLARAHCAARHRSHTASPSHARMLISVRGEVAGTQSRVRRMRDACARTTDVSKAADAVFVMLMPSLLTAQRVTLLCCVGARGG